MKRMQSLLMLGSVLIGAALAGCGVFTSGRSDSVAAVRADSSRVATSAESLLAYHAYVKALSAADWQKESELLRDAMVKEAAPKAAATNEVQRLRLAVLVMAPAAPGKERARALPLLEQLERDGQKSASRLLNLITLLRADLVERRRLEERLSTETRRADDLEQKLNELVVIERNLHDRSRPVSGPKKP